MYHNTTNHWGVIAGTAVILVVLLTACAGVPTPAPTQPPTATPPAAPTGDAKPAPSRVPYVNIDGNFTMFLPADWTISASQQTPIGAQYLLGPNPQAGGPANSTIIVADASKLTINQAISQLCGGGCAEKPKLETVYLSGVEAWRTTFGAPGSPPLVWYFAHYEDKLIIFSIHDPVTLKPLDDVIQTISFGSARELDPATVPASAGVIAQAAKQFKTEAGKVRIMGIASAEWPNGCLGLPTEGELCTEAIVPGYGGMLEVGGRLYEFRSDREGQVVRFLPAGVLAARQVLAQQLHLDLNSVRLVQFEGTNWPDACLGIALKGQACAKQVTPGYRVTVEAEGGRYTFHTDANGENVMLASAPPIEIQDAGIVWKQTTTICETAQISQAKVAFGACDGAIMGGKFAFEQRSEDYRYFIETYAPFEARTPAGEVIFRGRGASKASAAEQRMIAEWAQLVYYEALGGRSGAAYGLILAWHREGGFAGVCEDLAVYVTGHVYASSCKGGQTRELGMRRLSAEQLAQIFAWADALKSFEQEAKDQAKADAMKEYLYFGGGGKRDASDAEKQAMVNLAGQLYAQMSRP